VGGYGLDLTYGRYRDQTRFAEEVRSQNDYVGLKELDPDGGDVAFIPF
jgi:hypothetical protein